MSAATERMSTHSLPTGHEFHVQHVVGMHRPRSPRLAPAVRWQKWLAGALGRFSSACCSVQSTPSEWRPVAMETMVFRELVMWRMRRGLSGGRCDWGCDVSPNGSLGDDEKKKGNRTAGDGFQIIECVCVCVFVSNPCTSTFSPIKLEGESWSKSWSISVFRLSTSQNSHGCYAIFLSAYI